MRPPSLNSPSPVRSYSIMRPPCLNSPSPICLAMRQSKSRVLPTPPTGFSSTPLHSSRGQDLVDDLGSDKDDSDQASQIWPAALPVAPVQASSFAHTTVLPAAPPHVLTVGSPVSPSKDEEENSLSVGMEVRPPSSPGSLEVVCHFQSPGSPPSPILGSPAMVPATSTPPELGLTTACTNTLVVGPKGHTPHHPQPSPTLATRQSVRLGRSRSGAEARVPTILEKAAMRAAARNLDPGCKNSFSQTSKDQEAKTSFQDHFPSQKRSICNITYSRRDKRKKKQLDINMRRPFLPHFPSLNSPSPISMRQSHPRIVHPRPMGGSAAISHHNTRNHDFVALGSNDDDVDQECQNKCSQTSKGPEANASFQDHIPRQKRSNHITSSSRDKTNKEKLGINMHRLLLEHSRILNSPSPICAAMRKSNHSVLNPSPLGGAATMLRHNNQNHVLVDAGNDNDDDQERQNKCSQTSKSGEASTSFQDHLPPPKMSNHSTSNVRDKEMLDDEIFELYMEHLWAGIDKEKKSNYAYLDSLLFNMYINGNDKSKVLKWVKAKKIFIRRYVFVPIVDRGHWSLLVLCNFGETNYLGTPKGPRMLLLDSLRTTQPKRLPSVINSFITDILETEEREELGQFINQVQLEFPEVPQQTRNDCGIYVLYFIYCFLKIEKLGEDLSQLGALSDPVELQNLEDIRKDILSYREKQDAKITEREQEISGTVQRSDSEKGKTAWSLAADKPRPPRKSTENIWSAPPQGTVKLNTDAAFVADNGQSAVGAVARDYLGRVLVSVSRQINSCNNVEEAEACAVLCGLQALSDVYRGKIILEADCQMIVNELQQASPSRSACYPMIADIKRALSSFESHQIRWVGRSCNALAHELAGLARSQGDQTLIADVPACLRPVLLSDCNHSM